MENISNNPWLALSTYEESDKCRFKGRGTDIQNMLKMLQQNEYVVCYAASGDGKSSLINAGVCPEMRKIGYFPIKIVFNTDEYDGKLLCTNENGEIDFDELIFRKIQDSLGKCEFETDEKYESITTDYLSSTMWWKLRTQTIQVPNGVFDYIPVLIFDQFEEILRAKWRSEFFIWLEELSSDECPDYIYNNLSEHEIIPIQKKFKAIFSMRYEYVGDLDYWASQRNFIPQLMHSRYFLKPLSRNQALEVINDQEISPTLKEKYNQEATNILDNINKDSANPTDYDEVPAVILSLVCHILFEKWSFDLSYPINNIGINSVIHEYYMEEIKSVGISNNVRRIIENTLISPMGNRLRIHLSDNRLQSIGFDNYINRDADKNLLSTHIVKINDNYVEFTHDRLVESILINRKVEEKKYKKVLTYSRIRFGIFLTLLCSMIGCCCFLGKKYLSLLNESNKSQELCTDSIYNNPIIIDDIDTNLDQYDWYNATSVKLNKNIHACPKNGIYCYGNVVYLNGRYEYAANAKKIIFADDIYTTNRISLNKNVNDVYLFYPNGIEGIRLANPFTIIHVPYGTTNSCINNEAFKRVHFVEMGIFETFLEKVKYEIKTQHTHIGAFTINLFSITILIIVCIFIWIINKEKNNMSKKDFTFLILIYISLSIITALLLLELYWLHYTPNLSPAYIFLLLFFIELYRQGFDHKYNLHKGKAKICIVYHSLEGKQFAQKLRNELIAHTPYTDNDISLDMTMIHHGQFKEKVFLKQISSIEKVVAIITEEELNHNIDNQYPSLLEKCKYLFPIIYSCRDISKEKVLNFTSNRKRYTHKFIKLGNDYGIDSIMIIFRDTLHFIPKKLIFNSKINLLFSLLCISFAIAYMFMNDFHDGMLILCIYISLQYLIIIRNLYALKKYKFICIWNFILFISYLIYTFPYHNIYINTHLGIYTCFREGFSYDVILLPLLILICVNFYACIIVFITSILTLRLFNKIRTKNKK